MADSKSDTPRTQADAMTNSEIVRQKYPKAVSEECGDFYQIVVVGAYGKATVLGQGRTVKWAWEDAAIASTRSAA